jgi:hypothetical protein
MLFQVHHIDAWVVGGDGRNVRHAFQGVLRPHDLDALFLSEHILFLEFASPSPRQEASCGRVTVKSKVA